MSNTDPTKIIQERRSIYIINLTSILQVCFSTLDNLTYTLLKTIHVGDGYLLV